MSGGLIIRGSSKKYKINKLLNDDDDDEQRKQIGGKNPSSQKKKRKVDDLEDGEIISSTSSVDSEIEEEPRKVNKKTVKAKKKVMKKKNVKKESKKNVETAKKKSPKVKIVKKSRSINIENSEGEGEEEDILSEQEGEFDDFIVPDRTQNTKSSKQTGGEVSDDFGKKMSYDKNMSKKVTKKKVNSSQSAPSARVGDTKMPAESDTRGKQKKSVPRKQLTKYIQEALLPIMQQQKEIMSYVTDNQSRNASHDYHSDEDSGDEGDIEFDLDSDFEDLL